MSQDENMITGEEKQQKKRTGLYKSFSMRILMPVSEVSSSMRSFTLTSFTATCRPASLNLFFS